MDQISLNKIKGIMADYSAKPLGTKKEYAVLIPLIMVENELHLLYEVRSPYISQPNETSFPGGRIEANESPAEAAMRETCEELNISSEQIELIGELDYIVQSSRVIYSFVGILHNVNPEDLQPNEEVASVFTLSLDYLMNNRPDYYEFAAKPIIDDHFPFDYINQGKGYRFSPLKHQIPYYKLADQFLWGFTADITDRFIDLIADEFKLTE